MEASGERSVADTKKERDADIKVAYKVENPGYGEKEAVGGD